MLWFFYAKRKVTPMKFTIEQLLALPVGSVLKAPVPPEQLTPDLYDEEGNLEEGYIDTEIFVRTGYHYFHDFVSTYHPGEWDAKHLVDWDGLEVLYVYGEN